MAVADFHRSREINLSEQDLEMKVGDLLHRQRLADKILRLPVGESKWYGPIKVRRTSREFLIRGVDGEQMEPIPHYDFGPPEMVTLLDHKIECSMSQL